MLIAVTDTLGSEHKFKRYHDWIMQGGEGVQTVTLSYKQDNIDMLKLCDALVLSGGHDVDPKLYRAPEFHPKIQDVDRKRDDFERNVLDRALKANLPVLGICRGLQLANVHLGGTLIPDLEEAGYRSHRSEQDAVERLHAIDVEKNSCLYETTSVLTGTINSSHHQAVLAPAGGLKVTARSDDGIIEAMELEDAASKKFFLLVQWHPERMKDIANPFSKNILENFLSAIEVTEH